MDGDDITVQNGRSEMTVTKKAHIITLCLVLAITTFGWPSAEASSPNPPSTAKVKKSSQKKKTTKRPRRRSSRRSRTKRLAKLTLTLQKQTQAAIARDNLRGEDMEVRQAALRALGKHAGTVVVMAPHTGQIYSIVNQEWALRKGFTPCSTIKPYIALAGMKENLITPSFQLATGQSALSLSLIDALSRSDNAYFQQIGNALGLSNLRRYVSEFGLGQPTGINLPGEVSGRIPDAESVKKSGVPYAASHGKGFEVTALQLAVFTAALANQGSIYQPQVTTDDGQQPGAGYHDGNGGGDLDASLETDTLTPVLLRQLDINEVERVNILAGMTGAVEFGTARLSYDPTLQVAGKTGTCTGADGLRVGLFNSFAALDRPRLVVVVITEGLHERGSLAAQIAGHIYQQLADRFQLRSTPFGGNPKSQIPNPK
jgi:cell division protein FtsI/penicillin-binding protein 2